MVSGACGLVPVGDVASGKGWALMPQPPPSGEAQQRGWQREGPCVGRRHRMGSGFLKMACEEVSWREGW